MLKHNKKRVDGIAVSASATKTTQHVDKKYARTLFKFPNMTLVVVLYGMFLSFCTAYPSYEIVPSHEIPPQHHYPPEYHGKLFDLPPQKSGYNGDKYGGYGPPSRYPELQTHAGYPPQSPSYPYPNTFDNNVAEKFNFNVGKGTHNTKHYPVQYQRFTYLAPNGQLYVYSCDKKKPYTVKKTVNAIFTGNKANASSRPNTSSNRNIPRRTNQLGIPSAALASLAGGGLG